MIKKRIIRNTVIIASILTVVQQFCGINCSRYNKAYADENIEDVENYNSYRFKLSPLNSEKANTAGDCNIKIISGDNETSFNLRPKLMDDVISNTKDVSKFTPGWIFITLQNEDGVEFYPTSAEWWMDGNTLNARIAKGTIDGNDKYKIEFLNDVTFKYDVKCLGRDDIIDIDDVVPGWQMIDGYWYFADENSVVQTGWKKINYQWYYFDENGAMQTGWIFNNNKWYYLNSDGSMAYNTSVGGYYLGADGSWIQ